MPSDAAAVRNAAAAWEEDALFDRDMVARARNAKTSGVLRRDGSFFYVLFTEPPSMRAIVRTGEELFTTTVARQAASLTWWSTATISARPAGACSTRCSVMIRCRHPRR